MRPVLCLMLLAFVAAGRAELAAVDLAANRPGLREPLEIGSFDRTLLQAAIFEETNRVRQAAGLPRFRHLPKLDAAADLQASVGAFLPGADHHNPFAKLADVSARVRAVGLAYERVAENIALTMTLNADGIGANLGVVGTGAGRRFVDPATGRPVEPFTYAEFAAAVVRQWMASPGHRANILDPQLRCLGCSARWRRDYSGLDTIYSVQVFCTPVT